MWYRSDTSNYILKGELRSDSNSKRKGTKIIFTRREAIVGLLTRIQKKYFMV